MSGEYPAREAGMHTCRRFPGLSAGAGRRGDVIPFIRSGGCPYLLSRARIIDASTAGDARDRGELHVTLGDELGWTVTLDQDRSASLLVRVWLDGDTDEFGARLTSVDTSPGQAELPKIMSTQLAEFAGWPA